MSEYVRIGLIGCGTIAEKELAGLVQLRTARLVATADVSAERAELLARRFGAARPYTDHREMLADPEVDAVIVSTPNHLHARHTIDAAEAGKHILVQKPLALSLEDVDAMDAAARRAGVTAMALMMNRFTPSYVRLKELIDQRAFGTPRVYRTHFSHAGIYKTYNPTSQWFMDPAKAGGGPLLDLGVHHFDLLRWLSGQEIESVSAEVATIDAEQATDNNAFVSLRFADGTYAQLFLSFTTPVPPGYTMARVEVYGSSGSAWCGPSSAERPPLRIFREGAADDPTVGITEIRVPESDAWANTIEHFAQCIQTGSQPLTTLDDGRRALQAVLACYQSSREGRRVALNEPAALSSLRR
jgi:UDP-N-acetylglucosamine 3-dehydrogenase